MKRSGSLKRSKTIYRQLQPGEAPPAGQPRRYTEGRGYIRLRWKIAKNEFVEVYEHRLAVGVPPLDVHHADHNKSNNDPSNLEPLSRREHAERHGVEASATSRRVNEWNGFRSQAAFDKANTAKARKVSRKEFLAQMSELYKQGQTVAEIGAAVNRYSATVSAALRAAGVVSRHPTGRNTDISGSIRQVVYARARNQCERCGANLTWSPRQVHHRRPRQMGGTRRPETNLPGNLVLLCPSCHAWVEANRVEATEQGWLVRSTAEPVLVPVPHYELGHCYLLNDGSSSQNPVPFARANAAPARRSDANEISPDVVRSLHADGVRASEMMRRLGISRKRLYVVFEDLGLPRFGAGRPNPRKSND